MQARALPTFVGLAVLVALNVNLGLLLATGPRNAGLVAALLPVLVVAAAAIIASNRAILIFGAFALDLSGVTAIRRPIVGHFWAATSS